MDSMNISLPEGLREFVRKQVQSGYGSASEYVRELIRSDQARKEQEQLERKLLEGLASGEGREFTAEDWDAIRDRVIASVPTRKEKASTARPRENGNRG